jgi:hypothetical protein
MLQVTLLPVTLPFSLAGPGQTATGGVELTSPGAASYTAAITTDKHSIFKVVKITLLRPTLVGPVDDPGVGDGVKLHPQKPTPGKGTLTDEPVGSSDGVTPLKALANDKLQVMVQMVCPKDPDDTYSATLTITSSNSAYTATVPLSVPTGQIDVQVLNSSASAAPGSVAKWSLRVQSLAGAGANISFEPEPASTTPVSVSISPITAFLPRRGVLTLALTAIVGDVTPQGSYSFYVAETIFNGAVRFTPFFLVLTVTKPPVTPPKVLDFQFSNTGSVWSVGLNHTDAEAVEGVLGAIAGVAALAIPGEGDAVAAALGGAAGTILMLDAVGGDKGVDIYGVVEVTGVIVTPHLSGMFGTLIQAAQVALSGNTVTLVEFILKASGLTPALASALGLQVAANVFSAVAAGTPLGWAIAESFGAILNLFEPAPDPNQHGGVHADRDTVGDWERFIMVQLENGNHIALLSWQGLFSAQGGGGGDVYANRPQLGPWETWTLIWNQDGTFSFQSTNGHFLTALNGGGSGSYCLSDRTAIGDWERFDLQNLPGGHIAIKTHAQGKYLSVQSGQ